MNTSRFPEGYLPYDQDALTSVYLKDYTKHPLSRSQQVKRDSAPLPSAPFDGTTTTRVSSDTLSEV